MNAETTVEFDLVLPSRAKQAQRRTEPQPAAPGRIPRVSRLMALAIRFQELIDAGEVADLAELARLGQVSRARVTQIMDLTLLAPDLQEEVLFLPRVVTGKDRVTERRVRSLARRMSWTVQRCLWSKLTSDAAPGS